MNRECLFASNSRKSIASNEAADGIAEKPPAKNANDSSDVTAERQCLDGSMGAQCHCQNASGKYINHERIASIMALLVEPRGQQTIRCDFGQSLKNRHNLLVFSPSSHFHPFPDLSIMVLSVGRFSV